MSTSNHEAMGRCFSRGDTLLLLPFTAASDPFNSPAMTDFPESVCDSGSSGPQKPVMTLGGNSSDCSPIPRRLCGFNTMELADALYRLLDLVQGIGEACSESRITTLIAVSPAPPQPPTGEHSGP
jgi:hypothetical protein